jgi:LysR family transcriptional regulator, glycine cleavage system transcriptional activator
MSMIRRLLPSLNTLVTFEAAVRCGTFARAAKELGVTSPAVSRTIGRLELHLGVPLFRRTPSGVVLTRDGDDLFSGVSQSFSEIERTLTRLRGRKQEARRPIVLSVSSAFATHWFMPRLARFQAHFPREEIRFQLVNGPLNGPADDADIAMRFDHKIGVHHHVHALIPELLVPVRAPQYHKWECQEGSSTPSARKMITLSEAQPDWASFFSSTTPEIKTVELLFSDYTLVVQAALVGQGIALGWLNVVSYLLAHGSLVPACAKVVSTSRRCELITRRGGLRIADEICNWMRAELHGDISAIKARYPSIDIRI